MSNNDIDIERLITEWKRVVKDAETYKWLVKCNKFYPSDAARCERLSRTYDRIAELIAEEIERLTDGT